MNDIISDILLWIKDDWKSNKFRFALEVAAWSISIGCSIIMALTVPHPPLLFLYPTWILGCGIYAWCSFTRKSFGMLANYLLLTAIDFTALLRLLFNN